jgi:hypothetical protein
VGVREVVLAGFTKLFSGITESSVWGQPDHILRVWIAMLARADYDGIVEGSIPGFAHLCHMEIERFEDAVKVLSGPDPYSRDPANEGRRIRVFPGGWEILNYRNYREQAQAKDGSRAPYMRDYRRRKREEAFREDAEAPSEEASEA